MAEELRLEEYAAFEDAKLVKLVCDGDETALSVLTGLPLRFGCFPGPTEWRESNRRI